MMRLFILSRFSGMVGSNIGAFGSFRPFIKGINKVVLSVWLALKGRAHKPGRIPSSLIFEARTDISPNLSFDLEKSSPQQQSFSAMGDFSAQPASTTEKGRLLIWVARST